MHRTLQTLALLVLLAVLGTAADAGAATSCKPRGTFADAASKGVTIADVHTTKSSKTFVCSKRRPRPLRVSLDKGDMHRILGVAGDLVLYASWLRDPDVDEIDSSLFLVNLRARKVSYLGDRVSPPTPSSTALDARGTVYVIDDGQLHRWRDGIDTALDRAPRTPPASARLTVSRTRGRDIVTWAGRRVDATQRAATVLRCFRRGADEIVSQDDAQGILANAGGATSVCTFANPRPIRLPQACEGPTVTWRPGWLTMACGGYGTLAVADLRAGTVPLSIDADKRQLAVSDFGAVAWIENPPATDAPAKKVLLWTPGAAAPAVIDDADEVTSVAWTGRTLSWGRRNRADGPFVRREHQVS